MSKTKLNASLTNRGFGLIQFKDLYGVDCRIQDSSSAEKACLWIGTEKDSMHLTRQMVKQLLPVLNEFVKQGDWLFRTRSFKRIKKRNIIS